MQIASPMPEPPPVTTATLPSSVTERPPRVRRSRPVAQPAVALDRLVEPEPLDLDLEHAGARERDDLVQLGQRAPGRPARGDLERHAPEPDRKRPAAEADDADVAADRDDRRRELRRSSPSRRSRARARLRRRPSRHGRRRARGRSRRARRARRRRARACARPPAGRSATIRADVELAQKLHGDVAEPADADDDDRRAGTEVAAARSLDRVVRRQRRIRQRRGLHRIEVSDRHEQPRRRDDDVLGQPAVDPEPAASPAGRLRAQVLRAARALRDSAPQPHGP